MVLELGLQSQTMHSLYLGPPFVSSLVVFDVLHMGISSFVVQVLRDVVGILVIQIQ